MKHTKRSRASAQLLWFIALYAGGVIVVAAASYAMRLLVI